MKKIIALLCSVVIIVLSSGTAFAADTPAFPFDDSRYFDYGDYSLHYRVISAKGETKGRILMIHGFLCSTYSWRNMASEMSSRGYECVLVDLPDFGYSTRETTDTNIIPREELMKSLMTSIAPMNEWIVAGHSMGGGVAINIAVNDPVRALLLYCPCPQGTMPKWAKAFMTSRFIERSMDMFFEYGTRITPLVRFAVFAATNDKAFTKSYDLSGVTDPVRYDHFGAGMCEMMYNVLPTKLDETEKITCPVLICQADHDMILNRSIKNRIQNSFPDVEPYIVQGGGHQCIENRAPELSDVTCDFIASNLK
ncbi:MAG: alpha/beta hydrolase [Clostridiales bacterium]|nr:alpha/beta hydrolase [Clostridiales bacterium]